MAKQVEAKTGFQELYSTDLEYWQSPDGLLLLESWARDGYNVPDIANRIGITRQGLERWMRNNEQIKVAICTGRELVDYKVENALLKAALGYKTKETKVMTTIRNGKTIETVKETIDKEMAPNVSACQTWLYNRKPDKWKSQNARNGILDDLDQDTSIEIKVIAGGPKQSGNASSTFEEPDTDWEEDVNKGVHIGKRKVTQQVDNVSATDDDEWEEDVEREENYTPSKKDKESNPVGCAEDDVDYWPDDWEDDE